MQKVKASDLSAEEKYNVLHELAVKEAQFNGAIVEALGVTLTAVVAPANPDHGRSGFAVDAQDTFTTAIPGQSFGVTAFLSNPSAVPLRIRSVSLRSTGSGDWHITLTTPLKGVLEANQRQAADFRVTVPLMRNITKACFHRKDVEQPYYDLDTVACLDHPLPPYPLEAWLELTVDGVNVRVAQAVQTVQHVVGRGGVYEPLVVAPAISVAATATAGIIPLGDDKRIATVNVRVRSNVKAPAEGGVHLDLPAGWQSAPQSANLLRAKMATSKPSSFSVTPQNLAAASYPIAPVAEYQGHQYAEGYETVGYAGLRPYNYYRPGPYKLVGIDVKLAPDLKVGYVMGTGDDVPQSLGEPGS